MDSPDNTQTTEPPPRVACHASLVVFRKIRRNGKCRMQGSDNTIYRNTGGFGSVYHGGVRYYVQVGMDTLVEPLSGADLTISRASIIEGSPSSRLESKQERNGDSLR